MAMMRSATLLVLLWLAGCSGPESSEPGTSAADEASAVAMFDAYEAARVAGNPEAAELQADQLRGKYPESSATGKLAPTLTQVRAEAEASRETRRLAALWDYQSNPIGNGQQRSASIFSRTVPAEDGEVAQSPDAQLVLRDHPSWGSSAYLLLAQSKFSCGRPCTMQIAFDDGEKRSFAGKQADSGKGPALFVEDQQLFIAAMSKARFVRIVLPKGSGTIPSVVFDVGGYAPERFAKP